MDGKTKSEARSETRPVWRNPLISRIDATGLLAILLVLLFVLMSPSLSGIHHDGISVDLPKAFHPVNLVNANREDTMVVAIFRDGKVFMGHDQVEVSDIPDKIREHLLAGSERKVYIRADADAKYADVAEVVDEIRAAGVEHIAFLAYQATPPRLATAALPTK